MKAHTVFHQRLRTSFRFKIIAVSIAILCITFGLTTYIWYVEISDSAKSSAERYVGSVLERINGTFETMMKDIDHLITYASIDRANVINVIKDRPQQTQAEQLQGNQTILNTMLHIYQFKTYMEGMIITTTEGNYYRVGQMPPYPELVQQPWFEKVDMVGEKSTVLPPHSNGADEVISVARNINFEGRHLGVVKADMNCSILEDCYGTSFQDFGQIYILDIDQEQMIYPLKTTKKEELTKALLAQKDEMQASGSCYAVVDGVPSLVIYNRLGICGWVAAGVVPKAEITREFRNTCATIYGVNAVLAVLSLTVLYFSLSSEVDNVMKLCKAVQRIDENGMGLELVVHSGDEIEALQDQIASMVQRLRRLIDHIRTEQEEKRNLELRILQNQITPHFLHNTLNTIKYLAVLQNATNIAYVTDSLSVLLQNNLKAEEYLTVEEEVKNIHSYLDIQKFKYSGKFQYSISVEPQLQTYGILKMLIQPVLENALKHGIGPMDGMGVVKIRMYREENALIVDITDNGVGMSQEKLQRLMEHTDESKRVGMKNVISRIGLHYGAPYGVKIESGVMGTKVILTLPIVNLAEKYGNGENDGVQNPDCR